MICTRTRSEYVERMEVQSENVLAIPQAASGACVSFSLKGSFGWSVLQRATFTFGLDSFDWFGLRTQQIFFQNECSNSHLSFVFSLSGQLFRL